MAARKRETGDGRAPSQVPPSRWQAQAKDHLTLVNLLVALVQHRISYHVEVMGEPGHTVPHVVVRFTAAFAPMVPGVDLQQYRIEESKK